MSNPTIPAAAMTAGSGIRLPLAAMTNATAQIAIAPTSTMRAPAEHERGAGDGAGRRGRHAVDERLHVRIVGDTGGSTARGERRRDSTGRNTPTAATVAPIGPATR